MTPAQTAECGTTRGGQNWTLFPLDSWSVLHAVWHGVLRDWARQPLS